MTTSTPPTTVPTVRKGYKDLIIWQRSMDLAAHTYRLTQQFPAGELQGIGGQMRHAAMSIPTGIAIGSKRGGRSVFRDDILSACSMCTELETLTQIAHGLGYITDKDMQKTRGMFIDLFGMMYKFAAALKNGKKASAEKTEEEPAQSL